METLVVLSSDFYFLFDKIVGHPCLRIEAAPHGRVPLAGSRKPDATSREYQESRACAVIGFGKNVPW